MFDLRMRRYGTPFSTNIRVSIILKDAMKTKHNIVTNDAYFLESDGVVLFLESVLPRDEVLSLYSSSQKTSREDSDSIIPFSRKP